MTESTPPDGHHVLREAPASSGVVDGEATPLVASAPPLEDEKTPLINEADMPADAVPDRDEPTGVVPAARLRLPRSGMEELDIAIADLEFALAHLGEQDRRLLAVVLAAFVSLFLPWFQLWNHGPSLPTSPLSGLEVAGLTGMLLIVPLGVILLAKEASEQVLAGRRRLAIRVLTALLALRFFMGLLGSPVDGLPWRHSFWALFPGVITLALVLGFLGRLPAWPVRGPLPPR